ncbi:MAG: NADH-quinone oxidoreductase subunit NuoK [Bacteroidetes bacterium]|nr:NADH-quinone oxidoreductase subunit NuoK [Bacteroidota bacterium]
MTLNHFLVLSALLFSIGLFGALSKRNAVAILMCIELMLNAVNIALVGFARFVPPSTAEVVGYVGTTPANTIAGQVFALFIITVAAAEAAVGLAIVLAVYRGRHEIAAEDIDLMKW